MLGGEHPAKGKKLTASRIPVTAVNPNSTYGATVSAF